MATVGVKGLKRTISVFCFYGLTTSPLSRLRLTQLRSRMTL